MPKGRTDSPREPPTSAAESLLLNQVQTTLLKLTERSLLETGLSGPQLTLLGALYWDGRALVPRRLRNTLVVEAQSLTGLIDRLEAQGLTQRMSHPTDRRKIRIQITPAGRKKYEQAAAHADETAEALFNTLTQGERSQLRGLLMKLRGAGYPLLDLRHESAYPYPHAPHGGPPDTSQKRRTRRPSPRRGRRDRPVVRRLRG